MIEQNQMLVYPSKARTAVFGQSGTQLNMPSVTTVTLNCVTLSSLPLCKNMLLYFSYDRPGSFLGSQFIIHDYKRSLLKQNEH